MNLFEPTVDESRQHVNFKNIIKHNSQLYHAIDKKREKEKEILQSWCKGFPDRDNKFVKEFQTTFNPSFWEIYLYKLFTDLDFDLNWDYSSPDFFVNYKGTEFVVEATTANKGSDERPNEWDKEEPLANPLNPDAHEHYLNHMNEANRYSMIRLANGIISKYKKYKETYSKLKHVRNKPFIIAISPFEQPFFYFQCSRPIMALLYDFYVDEEA